MDRIIRVLIGYIGGIYKKDDILPHIYEFSEKDLIDITDSWKEYWEDIVIFIENIFGGYADCLVMWY